MISLEYQPLTKSEIENKQTVLKTSLDELKPKFNKMKKNMNLMNRLIISSFFLYLLFILTVDINFLSNSYMFFIRVIAIAFMILPICFYFYETKMPSLENEIREYERELHSISYINNDLCLELRNWINDPNVSQFRDKVVEECRIFTNTEYDIVKAYIDSVIDKNDGEIKKKACSDVFLSGIMNPSN